MSSAIEILGPYIAVITIAAAVFAYLLAQHYQRKVFPRVEFHRTGPNSETYPCIEIGNRLLFQTGGTFSLFKGTAQKHTHSTIIMAAPEIKVFGFKTIRLHHVIEGYNQTVDIRDMIKKNPEKAMGGGVLAVSEGVMATSFDAMSKSIPKTKADMLMNVVFILVGLGWGLLLGSVLG